VLNLAFDTATTWGRFALADDDRLLEYRPFNVSGNYADALLPVIQEMLEAQGRCQQELATIGVTLGPGSFTGVRIGVATAKSLAWGLGCELVAVGSLEAMAAALLAEHPEANLAVPVLDARRGEVYSGLFQRAGNWVQPVLSAAASDPSAWWSQLIATVDDPDAPVYGGDGTALLLGQGDGLRPELSGLGEPVQRRWSAAHPPTARALVLALHRGSEADPGLPRIHPFALVPDYLRGSDAELKRDLDLTPRTPSDDISIHRTEEGPAG